MWVIAKLGDGKDPCAPLDISYGGQAPEGLELYAMLPYVTTIGSGDKTPPGTYYDALLPLNSTTCSVSPYRFIGMRAKPMVVTIEGAKLTIDPTRAAPKPFPFYMGSTNSYQILGHCKAYCNREVELQTKYWTMLNEHGVYPFKSTILPLKPVSGKLNIDDGGDASFRNAVMKYSPGMVDIPPPAFNQTVAAKTAYYQAAEATVKAEGLVGRAYSYFWDEPGDLTALATEMKLAVANAPSIRLMVTTSYSATLSGLISIYSPIINYLTNPGLYAAYGLWPYASCQDSCGPDRNGSHLNDAKYSGPDTGKPDFLIDRPASNILAFIKGNRAMGATGNLYYESTEGYKLAPLGVDLFRDAWNFGGHGDGLLTYPGRPGEWGLTEHTPIKSIRLKLIQWATEQGDDAA